MRLGRHNQIPRSCCGYAAVSSGAASVSSASDGTRLLLPQIRTIIAFSMTTFRGRSQALRPTLCEISLPESVSSMSAPARRELAACSRGEDQVRTRRPLCFAKRERWTTEGGFRVR